MTTAPGAPRLVGFDFNNDGSGDFPVSIIGYDSANPASGAARIWSGASKAIIHTVLPTNANTLFGWSVGSAGDVTGDGLADLAIVDHAMNGDAGASGRVFIFAGRAAPALLSGSDAHRVLVNSDMTLRHFAAQVDIMHPDLWPGEPVVQVISLTAGDTGGVNEGETRIDLIELDGTPAGSKGYRPTLVLAGDVNLDGKVDVLDLNESISQLGTDPQATGVMPIADLNDDGIVDMFDIELVLNSYGEQTDIYTGLWDGSRLLAVVGGATGFGSIGSGPSGGAWGEAPGITPIGRVPWPSLWMAMTGDTHPHPIPTDRGHAKP